MALRTENGERAFKERVRRGEIPGEPLSRPIQAKSDCSFEGSRPRFDFAKDKLCNFSHRRHFAAHRVTRPQAVITGKSLQRIIDTASQLARVTKSRLRFPAIACRASGAARWLSLVCSFSRRWRAAAAFFTSSVSASAANRGLRLFNLGEFRRRRKTFERGREDGVGVGGAAGRLIEIGKRQRRAQFEALGLLLLRDGDSGEERFFN